MSAGGGAGGCEGRLRALERRIGSLALADERRVGAAVARMRGALADGGAIGAELRAAEALAERSAGLVARRVARGIPLRFPAELPVSARREEIASLIGAHPVVIVSGDTGSGKSTQIPKICLGLGRGFRGRIGCTQPRRIAAASVARRVATEVGCELGGAVGYQVRFDDRTSDVTRVKFMTDGILLAETRGDGDLLQYDTLIIDEAHERNLNVDFLLGYLKRLLERRPDLKVVISSATIDVGSFRAFFGGAPHLHVEGRTYPIEDVFLPPSEEEEPLSVQVGRAVEWIGDLDAGGDILVFLPGERQIREATELLTGRRLPGTEILPLYGRMGLGEQQRVFQASERRRIVLATNVAETSLTIPGIRYVIDSGLARISRYNGQVQRLQIEPVSQASARQRRGRCGRVAEGICVRLYAEEDLLARADFTDPEIRRSSLASVILQMKALGLGEIEEFPFVDPPRGRHVQDGYRTLEEIGAIDGSGELTAIGSRLARLPIDPRLGRMILRADEEERNVAGVLGAVLVIASGLSLQDPRERPAERREEADRAHGRWSDPASDFLGLVRLWEFFQGERRGGASNNRLRRVCRDAFLSARRMMEWENLYGELAEALGEFGWRTPGAGEAVAGWGERPAAERTLLAGAIHRCVIAGAPSHIGMREERGEYRGAAGRKFRIFPGSSLAQRPPPWVIAFELVETARLYARQAAAIDPVWVERVAPHVCRLVHSEAHWDRARGFVSARETVRAFGLTLVEGRAVHFGRIDRPAAREIFLREALAGDDLGIDARFLEHNRAVVEALRLEEAKLRRPDTILDIDALATFYSGVVPGEICDRHGFERWRGPAERADPRLLWIEPGAIVFEGAPRPSAALYPDRARIGGREFDVRYFHEPGEPRDGACVDVPVEHLEKIDRDALDWVVPGHLEEKVALLLRTLPKEQRIACQPLATAASEFAGRMSGGAGARGSLPGALTGYLREARGVSVAARDFDPGRLPDRLRVKVRVLGEEATVLGVGEDLDALRRAHGAQRAERVRALGGETWNRSGIARWDFGDLPVSVGVGDGAEAYPALTDEGASVGLRLFPRMHEAERAHRLGVARLFRLVEPGVVRQFERGLPLPAGTRLALAALPGDRAALMEDLVGLALDVALGNDGGAPRGEEEFRRRRELARGRLWAAGEAVAGILGDVLGGLGRARSAMEGARGRLSAESVADVNAQVAHLFAQRFLVRGWMARLSHYPRYLRALGVRVERMLHAPPRDVRKLARLLPARGAAERLARAWPEPMSRPPEVERYLWLVEEFRVSLFAPEQGTAERVSEGRLSEALALAESAP